MNQVMGEDEQVKDFIGRFHTNSDEVETSILEEATPIVNTALLQSLLEQQSIVFEDQFETKSLNERYTPKDPKAIYEAEGVKQGQTTGQDTSKMAGDYVPKDLLKDNDVKKANEIVPSLLHVRVKQAIRSGVTPIDFIIGVKAALHPVTSNDMIFNLTGVLTKKGKFFDFLRWSTGEIKLVKDLILGLDDTKNNIKAQYDKKSSAWWNLLRNRKTLARLAKWNKTKPILPNATIVVSQEEVDFIKANSRFDLLEAENTKRIMEELGLIQFVIVDASTEIAHFFIDGQKDFQTYTFKSIERENGNSERQFKEILKLAGKL